MLIRRALCVFAVIALGVAGTPLNADVIRESTGLRRAELDKMELQMFPADAWGKLSSWTGGDALTTASTSGKPVLIVTWASWHPASLKALGLAQKMADKYGPQGLIVVGAHGTQGWADAPKAAADRGVKFPLALDEKGEFRKALKIDHDPEYYVLDRAGHLRYAAVSSPSVEEACAEVSNETPAQAGDLPKILKDRADQEAAAGRKSKDIRTDMDLASLPPLPPGYSQPTEAVYKAADWPKIDEQLGKDYNLVDQQGNRATPKLAFQPQAFYPSKPETQGRAQVIYFWHPDLYQTYSNVMPAMDLLQQQHPRDLAVIGALVPRNRLDTQQNNDPNNQEQPEKLMKRYQGFVGSRRFQHALAADMGSTALAGISSQGSNKTPGVLVVSSDGVIRWAGPMSSPSFRYAVDTVLENDPGIKARRAADQKYIESMAK